MPHKVCMIMPSDTLGSYENVAKVLNKNSFNLKIICLGRKSQPRLESLSGGINLERINSEGLFH